MTKISLLQIIAYLTLIKHLIFLMKNLGFCAIDSKAVMTELKTARFTYDTQFTSLKNTNQPILSSFKKKKNTNQPRLHHYV